MRLIAVFHNPHAMAFLNFYRALQSESYRDFCSVSKSEHNLITEYMITYIAVIASHSRQSLYRHNLFTEYMLTYNAVIASHRRQSLYRRFKEWC